MHLTLKKEATKPASANFLQQQARFDDFIDELQPRAAAPGARHGMSGGALHALTAPYRGLPDSTTRFTTRPSPSPRAAASASTRKINLSHVFAGQTVGVKQVEDQIWLVSFMHYDLGYFDDETCRLEPIENPFGPKVLPMSPE